MTTDSIALSIYLGVVVGLVSLTFSANAINPPAAQAVFFKRCGVCHYERDLERSMSRFNNEQGQRTFLEKHLTRHHAPDANEREMIIDYLIHYRNS